MSKFQAKLDADSAIVNLTVAQYTTYVTGLPLTTD